MGADAQPAETPSDEIRWASMSEHFCESVTFSLVMGSTFWMQPSSVLYLDRVWGEVSNGQFHEFPFKCNTDQNLGEVQMLMTEP
jgi:hypothetical protein